MAKAILLTHLLLLHNIDDLVVGTVVPRENYSEEQIDRFRELAAVREITQDEAEDLMEPSLEIAPALAPPVGDTKPPTPEEQAKPFEAMTVAELKAEAARLGVTIEAHWRKADIIARLTEALTGEPTLATAPQANPALQAAPVGGELPDKI